MLAAIIWVASDNTSATLTDTISIGNVLAALSSIVSAGVLLGRIKAPIDRVQRMLDDFRGEPGRPGVPARPGVMERIANSEHVHDDLYNKIATLQKSIDEIKELITRERH